MFVANIPVVNALKKSHLFGIKCMDYLEQTSFDWVFFATDVRR